jgi:predicted RNase H-like HicB family nuclease
MSARRYPVIIEQTETGYSAYSPDVSGCVVVGDSEDETRQSFQEALIAHVERCVNSVSQVRNRTRRSSMWKSSRNPGLQ